MARTLARRVRDHQRRHREEKKGRKRFTHRDKYYLQKRTYEKNAKKFGLSEDDLPLPPPEGKSDFRSLSFWLRDSQSTQFLSPVLAQIVSLSPLLAYQQLAYTWGELAIERSNYMVNLMTGNCEGGRGSSVSASLSYEDEVTSLTESL